MRYEDVGDLSPWSPLRREREEGGSALGWNRRSTGLENARRRKDIVPAWAVRWLRAYPGVPSRIAAALLGISRTSVCRIRRGYRGYPGYDPSARRAGELLPTGEEILLDFLYQYEEPSEEQALALLELLELVPRQGRGA